MDLLTHSRHRRRAAIDAALQADREARRAQRERDEIANTVACFERAQVYGLVPQAKTQLYRVMTGAPV